MEKKPSDPDSQNGCENFCGCLFHRRSRHHRRFHRFHGAGPHPAKPGVLIHPSNGPQLPKHNGHGETKTEPVPDREIAIFLEQQRQKLRNNAPEAGAVMSSGDGEIVIESATTQETRGREKELKRTKTDLNDKVSDYITRTKHKLRNLASFSAAGKPAT